MLKHIPPDDLPGVWEFVSAGLQTVLARGVAKDNNGNEVREPWNTDDVYRCLRSSRAYLFVHENGFLILARREEEWSLEPYLLVWVGWFQKGSALVLDGELFDWLDAQARLLNCKRLRIISPRMGWLTRLKGYFTLRYQTWERVIK